LGLSIQRNSEQFFENKSVPSGIITTPNNIPDTTAKRIKDYWEKNYSGTNVGRGVAVLGDGLTFEGMKETSTDAQLTEQLKLTAEMICTAYGVPPFKIGAAPAPPYNNVESLNQQYYSDCIQTLIQDIESLLDSGLGLTEIDGKTYGTDFDERDLLRMDTATKSKTWGDLVGAGIVTPNEARAEFQLKATDGGDTPYMQEQNYALSDLAKRSKLANPFGAKAPPQDTPAPPAQRSIEDELLDPELIQFGITEFDRLVRAA